MNIFAFIIISFIVGFFSDVALNDLSRTTQMFASLKPYYISKQISVAGALSGITIVIATIILMIIFKMVRGKYLPDTLNDILVFLAIGYPVGYIIDVAIDKTNILGKELQPFYKSFGSGNSGAVAFEFALMQSLLTAKMILPYCCVYTF